MGSHMSGSARFIWLTGVLLLSSFILTSCLGDEKSSTAPAGGAGTYYLDVDGDGYGGNAVFGVFDSQPTGYVASSTDCDDSDPLVNPDAEEVCKDFIDNDCNGEVDELFLCSINEALVVEVVWDTPGDPDPDDHTGADLDLHFLDEQGNWFTSPDDCYFANPHPNWGSPVLTGDNPQLLLDDIDGEGPEISAIDSPAIGETYTVGVHYYEDNSLGDSCATLRVYVTGAIAYSYNCKTLTEGDFWKPVEISWTGSDANIVEIDTLLAHIDADNDGYTVDIDCDDKNPLINPATVWYEDGDGDGYGSGSTTGPVCAQPIDHELLSNLAGTNDCDDSDPAVNPETAWYEDADDDGYGSGAYLIQCTQPGGHYLPTDLIEADTDCDDADSAVNPATVWYLDGDGDGYGLDTTVGPVCAQPIDHYLLSALFGTDDCDDSDAGISPATIWYYDGDGDDYGTAPSSAPSCTAPASSWQAAAHLTETDSDCDDGDSAVNPGQAEVCNGIDDDCNGLTDNSDPGITGPAWYYDDGDSDGYGDEAGTAAVCQDPGMTTDHTDCDDGDGAIHPGVIETGPTCTDGIDNNCNGFADDPTRDGC